jgi:hypothetical protein
MDGFNEKKWFVYLTDHHEGPFSLAEIQAKMAQSQVSTANYVWAEGLTDWKPMTEVPEFESLLHAPQQVAAAGGGATVMLTPELSLDSADAPAAAAISEQPDVVAVAQPEPEPEPASVAAPTLAIADEKTGDLDPEDLKRATAQPLTEAIAAPGTAPAPAATKGATKSGGGGVARILKWAATIVIPVAIAGAYFNGGLDPVLNSPAVKAGVQTLSDLTKPYLLKLADRVPALAKWISPIPSLEDVTPEDYEALKAAAMQKLADGGPRIAIALSGADAFKPAFYVATNLPDGTVIDFYVDGIPDTLLNQMAFHAKVKATIDKKLGKSAVVRSDDGKPLPRGEYVVYATEDAAQPATVKPLLAAIPSVTAKVPSGLPLEIKLLVSKTVFLGGLKDATYASRLKEYHDKLRAKATSELADIKQLEATLEGQLAATNGKFVQLKGLVRGGKPTFAARKSWNDFNANWNKLQDTLRQSYSKWTDQELANGYFYGVLFSLTKAAGEAVDRIHQLHADFFAGRVDMKAFEIQRGSAVSVAESAVVALKNKIAQAESLTPTPNGMPRREGL